MTVTSLNAKTLDLLSFVVDIETYLKTADSSNVGRLLLVFDCNCACSKIANFSNTERHHLLSECNHECSKIANFSNTERHRL